VYLEYCAEGLEKLACKIDEIHGKKVESLTGSSSTGQSPRQGFSLKRECVVRKEIEQGNAVKVVDKY